MTDVEKIKLLADLTVSGDEFFYGHSDDHYRFHNGELERKVNGEWLAVILELVATRIERLPWKPKNGDIYYTYNLNGAKWYHWHSNLAELSLLKHGLVFRTEWEAEERGKVKFDELQKYYNDYGEGIRKTPIIL